MMLSEFQTLTGIFPCWLHWEEINRTYNESKMDKHDWCDAYVENRDGIASAIAGRADERLMQISMEAEAHISEERQKRQQLEQVIESLTDEIHRLEEQIDAELEWTAAPDVCTAMPQADYVELAKHDDPMTDEQAIARIADEFGFTPEKIKIVRTVGFYEINRHGKIRLRGEHSRPPVWASTDWNYIRFNVCGTAYECVNGEIQLYYA
jgi:hypothetical protein